MREESGAFEDCRREGRSMPGLRASEARLAARVAGPMPGALLAQALAAWALTAGAITAGAITAGAMRAAALLAAMLVSGTLAAGCARVSPEAALAVADCYYAALGNLDVEAACRLMTESQRASFEGGACVDVMRFLLQTDGPPGRRALQERGARVVAEGDRQRFELRFQVAYRNGVRVDILTIVGTAGQPDSFRIDGIARQEALAAD